jgi:hypothetical protein
VARILIVGGGCRGRRLAAVLTAETHGHAVRITTRTETGRAAIEQAGAECWIGTPDRLATLRGALESVTVVCWLLSSATGPTEQLAALYGPRLEFFLGQAIDTTVRGFVYESPAYPDGVGAPLAPGASARKAVTTAMISEGKRIVRAMGERNTIPLAFLTADPTDADGWLAEAQRVVGTLLRDHADDTVNPTYVRYPQEIS